jgi:cyclophilin family peptidyl-prolyl cis-trans isomerase
MRIGVVLANIGLIGCAHHETPVESSSAPAPDSAYTGLPPSYPRAMPVTLPANAVPIPPPPPPVAVSSPAAAATPSEAPMEVAASSSPASDQATPAPTQAAPDSSPVETTPPSPPVVTAPPRPLDENEAKRQVVVLDTSLGNIVIELDDVAAPRTCGNFRKLVSSGFYNHTIFHRVIPHFIIQGGDPNSRSDDRRTYGLGDPGYTLPAEIKLKHVAGAVAMARLPDAANPQRDSNGSQFYICVAACPSLDDQYTVFGHVIRGMDAATKIANQPRDKTDDPFDRIEIQASLETKQQALEENPR